MAKDSKKATRLKRAKRSRSKFVYLCEKSEKRKYKLCVHKSPRHMYAQVIEISSNKVVATSSTVDKVVRDKCKYTGNKDAAAMIGGIVAEKAKKAGVEEVIFDRAGFLYHGRVKALADAARKSLKF
ncbi:MAG: 50S ribosomal protein L18 [Thiotrichales bacterium]|nr:MAG: 50S ribosomal protein L18 [Thiotrichales bacterium]